MVGLGSSAKEGSVNITKDLRNQFKSSQKIPTTPRATRTSVPVPSVAPVFEIPSIPVTQQSVRQRAAEDPALAATLLGGLGSAGLL